MRRWAPEAKVRGREIEERPTSVETTKRGTKGVLRYRAIRGAEDYTCCIADMQHDHRYAMVVSQEVFNPPSEKPRNTVSLHVYI